VLAIVTREAEENWAAHLKGAVAQAGECNDPPRPKAMTVSEQFWWLTPFIFFYFFPEPNGFSCPLLHHAPTRSIAFALTKPVHYDRRDGDAKRLRGLKIDK
jgi:hypothetical protein